MFKSQSLLTSLLSSLRGEEVRPKEAAALINCSVPYVYKLMDAGQLDHRSIKLRNKERGKRLITMASIERFLAEQKASI